MAFSALCSIAGAIVSSNKPAKPSVVEQLAQVVHSELNNFFDKLQGVELSADFPMRIVLGTVGRPKGNLEFVEDVKPHSYYSKVIWSLTGTFSTGGYIKIANKEKLSSAPGDDDPNETDVRVIEFALSSPFAVSVKINIQDKTDSGRSKGKDAYDKMTNDKGKTLYWKKGKVHHLAREEVLRTTAEQILDWVRLRKFNSSFYFQSKGNLVFYCSKF